jgi:hypothetical protein
VSLFVDPAELPRWASARALVFLVGGHEGGAGFGGVARLRGVLRRVGSDSELVTAVVVVAAEGSAGYQRIDATWPDDLEQPLVALVAEADERVPDGLVPLPSLANAIGVVLYLLDGDYADRRRRAGAAAMAAAVSDWVSGPWPGLDGPPVVATGLQVDASLAEEAEGLVPWLRRARLLTGHDMTSVEILARINARAGLDSGAGPAVVLTLLDQWDRHVGALSSAYADAATEAARLRSAVGDHLHAVEASAKREIRLQAELDATRARLDSIEQSRIWRATGPYRRFRFWLRGSAESDEVSGGEAPAGPH